MAESKDEAYVQRTLRLPSALHWRFVQHAKAKRIPVNSLLIILIEKYLKEEGVDEHTYRAKSEGDPGGSV